MKSTEHASGSQLAFVQAFAAQRSEAWRSATKVWRPLVLVAVLTGCAAVEPDPWCETPIDQCLDEGLGPCAPRIDVSPGRRNRARAAICEGVFADPCGQTNATVRYALDDTRVRVHLWGVTGPRPFLHGAHVYVDVPRDAGRGGERGAVCLLNYTDLSGPDGCMQSVDCAIDGSIVIADDGTGTVFAEFSEHRRLGITW